MEQGRDCGKLREGSLVPISSKSVIATMSKNSEFSSGMYFFDSSGNLPGRIFFQNILSAIPVCFPLANTNFQFGQSALEIQA